MVFALIILGCSRHRSKETDPALRDALQRECPDLDTWAACQVRQAATVDAAVQSAQIAQANADNAAVEKTKAMSAPMSVEQRRTWVRQCVQKLSCKAWQIDAIIDAAPLIEQPQLARVSISATIETMAKLARDGEKLSVAQVGPIAAMVARDDMGLDVLDLLSITTVAEAKKDPAGARGKTMRLTGRIIEIRKTGDLYEGALAIDGGTFIRFATLLSTAKLFEDSNATFRGVFVQEYDYANVSGGQTRSLYLVGGFDIPENRVALPPKVAVGAAKPNAVAASTPESVPTVSAATPNKCNPPFVIDPKTGTKTYRAECL